MKQVCAGLSVFLHSYSGTAVDIRHSRIVKGCWWPHERFWFQSICMRMTNLAVGQSIISSCCLIQVGVLVLGHRESINCSPFFLLLLGSKMCPVQVVGFLLPFYSHEICVSHSNNSWFHLKKTKNKTKTKTLYLHPDYFIQRSWMWVGQRHFYTWNAENHYSPCLGPHWML